MPPSRVPPTPVPAEVEELGYRCCPALAPTPLAVTPPATAGPAPYDVGVKALSGEGAARCCSQGFGGEVCALGWGAMVIKVVTYSTSVEDSEVPGCRLSLLRGKSYTALELLSQGYRLFSVCQEFEGVE